MRLIPALMLLAFGLAQSSAATVRVVQDRLQQTVGMVRTYAVAATPGTAIEVRIPLMVSFWGATNQQVVKSSRFEFSEQPDLNEPAKADDRWCRWLRLVWNAPRQSTLRIVQTLEVELASCTRLSTAASLPYAQTVTSAFADLLISEPKEGIDLGIPEVVRQVGAIMGRTKNAEEAVELACDWVNENITFEVKTGDRSAAEALAQKKGSCSPMSRLACSLIRRMGIPADMVRGSGHRWIEVYFPDAGWVFYDLSNHRRGFAEPLLVAEGEGLYQGSPGEAVFRRGEFTQILERKAAENLKFLNEKPLRSGPAGFTVLGATVTRSKPASSVNTRHMPMRALLADFAIPSGVRSYDRAREGRLPGFASEAKKSP